MPTMLELLRQQLKPGQEWIAYQPIAWTNAPLRFVRCGEDCGFVEPPGCALVGKLNLQTGQVMSIWDIDVAIRPIKGEGPALGEWSENDK